MSGRKRGREPAAAATSAIPGLPVPVATRGRPSNAAKAAAAAAAAALAAGVVPSSTVKEAPPRAPIVAAASPAVPPASVITTPATGSLRTRRSSDRLSETPVSSSVPPTSSSVNGSSTPSRFASPHMVTHETDHTGGIAIIDVEDSSTCNSIADGGSSKNPETFSASSSGEIVEKEVASTVVDLTVEGPSMSKDTNRPSLEVNTSREPHPPSSPTITAPVTLPISTEIDNHPLTIGHCLVVEYRDGTNRLAKIIERSERDDQSWSYYIHYFDFNRRMDEWVTTKRIVSLPSVANSLELLVVASSSHKHSQPGHNTTTGNKLAPSAATAQANAAVKVDITSQPVQPSSASGKLTSTGGTTGTGKGEVKKTHKKAPGRPSRESLEQQAQLQLQQRILQSHGSTSVSAAIPTTAVIPSNLKIHGSGAMAIPSPHGGALSTNPDSLYSTVAELDHDEHEGLDEASLLEHEEVTKVKNIQFVQLGKYIMECWYFSPFPKEYYPNGFIECIYFCEYSMRFFRTKDELIRYHELNPSLPRHPPGNEIYRDNHLSMFELDGSVEKIYCQNLCYFAKLFLDHKTLYWDVDPFLFYVLCTRDEKGYHPVGYFSKEKYSDLGYNLACILTFPCVQRQGIGRFLIEFSYALSRKEDKVGSPEKPLSDLGALGYRSYWAGTILRLLKNFTGHMLSVVDITMATSILAEDVVSTLTMLGLLQKSTIPGDDGYFIYAPPDLIDELLKKYPENKYTVNHDRLHWISPYPIDPKKDKWSMHTLKNSASTIEKQYTLTSTTSISSVASTSNLAGQSTNGNGGIDIKPETHGMAMEVA